MSNFWHGWYITNIFQVRKRFFSSTITLMHEVLSGMLSPVLPPTQNKSCYFNCCHGHFLLFQYWGIFKCCKNVGSIPGSIIFLYITIHQNEYKNINFPSIGISSAKGSLVQWNKQDTDHQLTCERGRPSLLCFLSIFYMRQKVFDER